MSLQCREFWDVYVRKYGSKAAHAGPKIIDICKPKSNPGGPRTNIRLRHIIPASDIRNPSRFSRTKTKIAHSFDVEKRRMIAIISEAAKGVKPEVMEPVLASGEYGGQTFISPGTRADPVQMDCPRFDEIRWYLETNKFALAIHTMDFNMPAHLFRSYIDRHGGISLTNVEWKTFLLVANTRNELFYYSHSGYGIILVNPAGWMRIPPPQATTLRKHPRPEEQLTEIFEIICGIYLNNVDLQRETKDMDTAYFKFCVNSIWETERGRRTNPSILDYPAMPEGFTWDPAGDELLDACIYYSDHFVDAPIGQGIVRRASVHAPSPQAPKRRKNAHELLTEGDPMRLGFKELAGEPLPRGPGD